ncbi:MAG: EAL domain-containing protein [Sulfurimonas sp.]|uniref:EAL domain-containing protein n=1 Tax=Sulfurimonas sp. TaxID=2022749 RepID=UPI002600A954|nr:EAL domain-containing protein [Sulfurimonas sp.]MCK9492212.1 EAL domain-containing protein [Sulfurimonas sp.]
MDKEQFAQLIKSTKKLNLLYVEDDKKAREATLNFLETFFLKIDTAVDGEQAYAKIELKEYDLIITDINMPKMNGLELIQKIRAIDLYIPILILSAYDDKDYFVQSIKYGVDGYILKPVELEQFYTMISKVTNKIILEKSLAEYKNNLEQKVEEKTLELRRMCYQEYYTDLPNAQKLQVDMLEGEYDYLLLLDMSNFSTINKEYGKVFSNQVLSKTARSLEHHIHKKARLYKVESDRFVILLRETSLEELHDYCKQIVAFFDNKNVKIDEVELHVTFNIGISTRKENAAQTLINSEYALDTSKDLGSRHYEIFNENNSFFRDEKKAIECLKITRELVLEDMIEPYFQAIVDIKTKEIKKYEVLARGVTKDAIVLPERFIKPAEKLGLMTSITKVMINKSFVFFRDKEYDFSINITERDLLDGYLCRFLKEKLEFYKVDAKRVTFEIKESITLAKDYTKIMKEIDALREMGFKIAIDDFGVNESNFSKLISIDIDFIKIDQAFIKKLKQDKKSQKNLKAIVNFAKTLDIQTIAKFVEDEETYKIIQECEVDFVQGYFIAKPESTLVK